MTPLVSDACPVETCWGTVATLYGQAASSKFAAAVTRRAQKIYFMYNIILYQMAWDIETGLNLAFIFLAHVGHWQTVVVVAK